MLRIKLHLIVVLAIVLLSSNVLAQGSLSYLDSKNGFRDLKFGSPISSSNGFKLDGTTDALNKSYTRTTDKLSIGNTPLEAITYTAYNGKLARVNLYSDPKFANEILLAFVALYGNPTKVVDLNTSTGSQHIEWNATKVKISALIIPYSTANNGAFSITIFSKPIDQQIEASRNAKRAHQFKNDL